jgi:curved DNA-binding protein CbpA
VTRDCNTYEIRKAFKREALKYHPDRSPKTTPLFQLMNDLSGKLTDPVQRGVGGERKAKECREYAQQRSSSKGAQGAQGAQWQREWEWDWEWE